MRYYVIFDPERHVQNEDLRSFVLHGTEYLPPPEPVFGGTDLGLTLWQGVYQDFPGTYLRWIDKHGSLVLTGDEDAGRERARAKAEAARADEAEARLARLTAQVRGREGSGG